MRASRVAITFFFLADGLVIGSFASRLPAVQRAAGLSTAHLGLALFGASAGALVAMPVAGRLCERLPSRRVVIATLLVSCGGLVGTSYAGSLLGLAGALFFLGAGTGSLNVAENAQGLALERRYSRPILSSFHAAFSAGGLTGAALGALAAAAGLGVRTQFALVAVTLLAAAAVAYGALLPGRDSAAAGGRRLVRPPRAVILLGVAAFCCFLAEGAAADWSAVYLVHSSGAGQAVAALGYTTFSLAMVASRLLGDRASRHAGPGTIVRTGALIAAVGLTAALLIGTVPLGLVGFAAMGAGLGVVVPVLFRAAAGVAGISAAGAVAAVSTVGWFGFLAGPPLIGLVSGAVGLRAALGLVVAATLVLAWLAPGDARSRSPRQAWERSESSAC